MTGGAKLRGLGSRVVVAAIALLSATVAVLSFKPLNDPDLGWHLASGLWMLDHFRLPDPDPFGAGAEEWWAYSWLFEVLVAGVFRWKGFFGLQCLQSLLVLFSFFCCALLIWLHSVVRPVVARPMAAVAGLATCIIFVSPIWHLRPQLVSSGLFALLLALVSSKKRCCGWAVLLSVLWANIHVYWVLVPACLAVRVLFDPCYRTPGRLLAVFLSLLAGALSPYGINNIVNLHQYLIGHDQAYGLISEFRGLGLKHDYLFVLFCCGVALTVVRLPRVLASEDRWLLFLTIALGSLSVFRIKFLPLYGISLVGLIPTLLSAPEAKVGELKLSDIQRRYALAFVILFYFGVLWGSINLSRPLPSATEELIKFVKTNMTFCQSNADQPIAVLNHFDDGGWLALAFYLAKADSRCRTSIDGRTLVMGNKRLRQFSDLMAGETEWCQVIESWRPSYAIVQKDSWLRDNIRRFDCGKNRRWFLMRAYEDWLLFAYPSLRRPLP